MLLFHSFCVKTFNQISGYDYTYCIYTDVIPLFFVCLKSVIINCMFLKMVWLLSLYYSLLINFIKKESWKIKNN